MGNNADGRTYSTQSVPQFARTVGVTRSRVTIGYSMESQEVGKGLEDETHSMISALSWKALAWAKEWSWKSSLKFRNMLLRIWKSHANIVLLEATVKARDKGNIRILGCITQRTPRDLSIESFSSKLHFESDLTDILLDSTI